MTYLPMTAFQKIMGDYMKNEKAKQFLRFLSVAGNFKLKTNAFLLSCFIVPALMLFSNIVMAQVTEEWVARYNGSGMFDGANAIAVDANGNVYVTGYSYGSGTSSDYATIKYDTNGNELWTARYNSPGNSYDQAAAIAVDANGNVYVTGYSYSGTSSDYATIKYDTNGNQLWVARYDGRDNSYDLATDIAVDASGNVYVTGGSYDSVTSNDYATIKYDTN